MKEGRKVEQSEQKLMWSLKMGYMIRIDTACDNTDQYTKLELLLKDQMFLVPIL